MLASAVGSALQPYMQELLGTIAFQITTCVIYLISCTTFVDLMFVAGLNQTLTDSLTELAVHIPSLLPNIQEKLLDHVSIILAGQPFVHPGSNYKKTK
jgi:hypothetical protein